MKLFFEAGDVVRYIPDGEICKVLRASNPLDPTEEMVVEFKDGTQITAEHSDLAVEGDANAFGTMVNVMAGLEESVLWGTYNGNEFKAKPMSFFKQNGCENELQFLSNGQIDSMMSKQTWDKLQKAGIDEDKLFVLKNKDNSIRLYRFENGKVVTAFTEQKTAVRISALLDELEDGAKIVDAEKAFAELGFVPAAAEAKKKDAKPESTEHVPVNGKFTNNRQYQKCDVWNKSKEMFQDYKQNGIRLRDLAEKYKCSQATAYRIIKEEEEALKKSMANAMNAA